MDKLRNIDQLLKNSLEGQEMVTPELSGDWLAIENRLRQRKNRIYAMWFSLALIMISTMVWFMIEPAGDPLIANEKETVSEQAIVAEEETITPEAAPMTDPTFEQTTTQTTSDIEPIIAEEANPVQPALPSVENTPVPPQDKPHVLATDDVDQESDPAIASEPVQDEATDALDAQDASNQDELAAEVENEPVQETPELDEPVEADEPVLVLDQQDDEGKLLKGHWEIGVAFTPAFTDKIMSTNTVLGGLIHQSFRDIVKSSESADLAYNSAVNVGYHWNNGWFLQSGIGLSQRAERVDYNYKITQTVKVDAKENRIVEYIPRQPSLHETVQYSGSNSYHFVEIPLQVGYRWKFNDKWEWRNQVGASYLLLTNSLGKKPDYTYLQLLELDQVNYLNAHNLSGHIRSGVYYNFKNFVIGAEPMAGVSFNSLNDASSAIQVQPYYYGFNLTTLFKLNGE